MPKKPFSLLSHPQVMGILNVAPHSFCEVGRHVSLDTAIEYAHSMVNAGASVIDVGGEPTNPGVHPIVSLQEERDRVIPVVSALTKRFSVPISVDTSKPEIMREAIQCGARLINDVRALQYPGALEVIADSDATVCLMHMKFPNGIESPPSHSEYSDIVLTVKTFLEQRIEACIKAGIESKRIILDPGIGGGSFGKNTQQNCDLLARLGELKSLGFPILVGVSRKSFIGEILDVPIYPKNLKDWQGGEGRASGAYTDICEYCENPKPTQPVSSKAIGIEERLYGSLAAAIMAIVNGAQIIRAHDVKATVEAIKVAQKIRSCSLGMPIHGH